MSRNQYTMDRGGESISVNYGGRDLLLLRLVAVFQQPRYDIAKELRPRPGDQRK